MLLNQLLQLPSPVGKLELLHQFATSLSQYQIDLKDVPELIAIATDAKLYYGSDREFFSMYYALYALGALKQVEECPKIVMHLNRMNADDEWVSNYIRVFEMMGEQVIPYLIQACRHIKLDLLFVLTESLAKLAIQYPAYREQVLQTFDEILFRVKNYIACDDLSISVESSILIGWLDMKAIERIEVIREIVKSHQMGKHITLQIDALINESQFKAI
ncbi:hypothetical protein [Acinetobacter rudis]|uniref:hypothetical protein n=1 Tax=Acinetobacter rudis TaxID=632955 RepID=UPI00333FEB69